MLPPAPATSIYLETPLQALHKLCSTSNLPYKLLDVIAALSLKRWCATTSEAEAANADRNSTTQPLSSTTPPIEELATP